MKKYRPPSRERNDSIGDLNHFFYTTGEVCGFLRVAPRTVAVWFDQGLLEGYRLRRDKNNNPCGDRRISRKSLIELMRKLGISDYSPVTFACYGLSAEATKSAAVLGVKNFTTMAELLDAPHVARLFIGSGIEKFIMDLIVEWGKKKKARITWVANEDGFVPDEFANDVVSVEQFYLAAGRQKWRPPGTNP